MRVNVYAEEMTDRVEIVTKEADGQTFTGLRLYLELPVTAGASSAVTFWGKHDLRDVLWKMLAELDAHYTARGSK